MQKLFSILLLLIQLQAYSQSKSVTRFRSDFKETSNMFFYSSTLKMLNTENNPDLAGILDEVEEIRVLNYKKGDQKFQKDDITALKNSLTKETYNNILMINEKGNSVNVYNHEKKGKTTGMVAIVENTENLVLIDLIGNIDVKKFLELKNKLESRSGYSL
jgi:hypothetical protein